MATVKKTTTETKAAMTTESKADTKTVKAAGTTTVPSSKMNAAPKAEIKTESKTPAKKSVEKKTSAKKAAKPEIKKDYVYVQFSGKEVEIDSVIAAAKADFKANNKGCVRTINVYVKPEDNTAYYVVNNKTEGKIEL